MCVLGLDSSSFLILPLLVVPSEFNFALIVNLSLLFLFEIFITLLPYYMDFFFLGSPKGERILKVTLPLTT